MYVHIAHDIRFKRLSHTHDVYHVQFTNKTGYRESTLNNTSNNAVPVQRRTPRKRIFLCRSAKIIYGLLL